MHKRSHQFKDHHKRSLHIVILLCMDLFSLTLTFIVASLQSERAHIYTMMLLMLDMIILIHIAFIANKNLIIVNDLKDYFYKKNYGTSESRVRLFHHLLDNNLLEYYFQPIINAKTGDIHAYEALMRVNSDKFDMLPAEILDIAAKENRLYDIEKLTFQNLLKIMNTYPDVFSHKKLFINCIPSHLLSDVDFDKLMTEYGSLFENIVLEISEFSNLKDSKIQLFHKRLKIAKCQLAIDIYHSVDLNQLNLSGYTPSYIKLDRSLLHYINIDTNKQSFVSSLVSYANDKNIQIIAEGIENFDEFEFMIGQDVHYIQGYYAAKPNPNPIGNLSEDLLLKIHNINYKKFRDSATKLVYETSGESELVPASISSEQYSSILINEDTLTLKGFNDRFAELSLLIPDNHHCELVFDNLQIRGIDQPSVIIGRNSSVIIKLVGNNYITNCGIRVMDTSDLTIVGEGNLYIQVDRIGKLGIGGSDSQSYGNITLATTGKVHVTNSGNMVVGIGGGQNTNDSVIRILSGNIAIETNGHISVGIGSLTGNARIEIEKCSLKIKAESAKSVAIGSIVGFVDIVSSGNLEIISDSKTLAAIGAIEDCEGTILFKAGSCNIKMATHCGSGIGCINGKMKIEILYCDIYITGEGNELVGLGDHNSNCTIRINNGILGMQLFSPHPQIARLPHKIIIDGGNIQCDFPEEIVPVNSYGAFLVPHIITSTDEFSQVIETVSYRYEYKASYSSRYSFIKIYLPEYSHIEYQS